jgi:hypothetical protein
MSVVPMKRVGGNGFGYIDKTGKFAIAAQFSQANE